MAKTPETVLVTAEVATPETVLVTAKVAPREWKVIAADETSGPNALAERIARLEDIGWVLMHVDYGMLYFARGRQ